LIQAVFAIKTSETKTKTRLQSYFLLVTASITGEPFQQEMVL